MAKTLYSQSGKIEYGIKKYVVDTEADKEALNLRTTKMGSKCYVMDTKKWYILNSSNQWIPFVGEGGFGNGSPFVLKGSVATVADLPDTNNKNGDLYIVTADSSEYVWIEEDPTGHWEQLGLEAEKFIINITDNNGQISADKTFAEMTAAYNKGQILIAICNETKIYHLSSIVDDEIMFIQPKNLSNSAVLNSYINSDNNQWEYRTIILTPVNATNVASAIYDMTAAQKTQALNNLDAEPKKMIITITYDNQHNEWVANKTFTEMQAAYEAGKTLEVSFNGFLYLLYFFDYASFLFVGADHNVEENVLNKFICDDDGVNGIWSFSTISSPLIPATITVSGSTPTITPEANTIYNCGELASLTISNPPSTGAYSIVFTSGSTATTTTIPATILGLEDFAAEANTIYEINVLDNRAVVGSWAVSA